MRDLLTGAEVLGVARGIEGMFRDAVIAAAELRDRGGEGYELGYKVGAAAAYEAAARAVRDVLR